MKTRYKVEGMSCDHCRRAVEEALNSLDGVGATVTLDPPVAEIEFAGEAKTPGELQRALSQAGDYKLSE